MCPPDNRPPPPPRLTAWFAHCLFIYKLIADINCNHTFWFPQFGERRPLRGVGLLVSDGRHCLPTGHVTKPLYVTVMVLPSCLIYFFAYPDFGGRVHLGDWRWYRWVGSCQYKPLWYVVPFGRNLRCRFWLGEGVVVWGRRWAQPKNQPQICQPKFSRKNTASRNLTVFSKPAKL